MSAARKLKVVTPEPIYHEPSKFYQASELMAMARSVTRIDVMETLVGKKSLNVKELCAETGYTQPCLSHHLKLLKLSHLCEAKRVGKYVYYSLTSAGKKIAKFVSECNQPGFVHED